MDGNESDLQQTIDQLASEAVLAAKDDYGVLLDFTPESLIALYKLLKRAHILYSSPAYAGKNPRRTIQVWGAYLGETLRRQNNGIWKENPAASENRQFSVSTPSGNIFPMEQVYLKVVPGIRNADLAAAMTEPPTRKVASFRWNYLLLGIMVLLGMAIGSIFLFMR